MSGSHVVGGSTAINLPVPRVFGSTCVPTIGTGANGYNMRHLRLYSNTTAPTLSALQAISESSIADTSAWADWGLADGSLADRSGNGRNLVPTTSMFRGLAIALVSGGPAIALPWFTALA